jgi:hypothetical protein
VYYREGDFTAVLLFKRHPRVYYVGECMDESKNHLLVKKGRTYVVYTNSGPMTFRTHQIDYLTGSEPFTFGYVDLNLENVKKGGSLSFIELLQSYLRNDLKRELFSDKKPFLPAMDILLVIRAL